MRIDVYVDDEKEPRASFEPPQYFELDTSDLADGPHRLVVRASESEGPRSLEEIIFTVRNGPGIAVVGLAENEIVSGKIPILLNAYQSRVGDNFEPIRVETPAPIPTWAWVLFLSVVTWGLGYLGNEYRAHASALAARAPMATANAIEGSQQEVGGTNRSQALGAQVYGNYCGACHQTGGEGLAGVFPPLQGDPVVLNNDPTDHIVIVLRGLASAMINGVDYTSPMPAFSSQLSDEEIAAVINHERSNWGNSAALTTTAAVAAVRARAGPKDPTNPQ
jgi:mono/diheme cytochrome c family protein